MLRVYATLLLLQLVFTKMICVFQSKYVAQCMEEIKRELKQDSLPVKANAVAKLTYVRDIVGLVSLCV